MCVISLASIGGRFADVVDEQAMNSTFGDLRRAAVNALVDAYAVLQDEQKIYSILDGLGRDQVSFRFFFPRFACTVVQVLMRLMYR